MRLRKRILALETKRPTRWRRIRSDHSAQLVCRNSPPPESQGPLRPGTNRGSDWSRQREGYQGRFLRVVGRLKPKSDCFGVARSYHEKVTRCRDREGWPCT